MKGKRAGNGNGGRRRVSGKKWVEIKKEKKWRENKRSPLFPIHILATSLHSPSYYDMITT